jgi:hypothetical protein
MKIRTLAAATTVAMLATAVAAQTPFEVRPYGPTCGPIATAHINPQGSGFRFALTVDQAAAREHVLVIVGIEETAVPIDFGMPCLLLTGLVYTELHMTNSGGSFTWSHTIPADFLGYARFQFAETIFCLTQGTLSVRTSNGIHLARI